jgi:hypothetical protein
MTNKFKPKPKPSQIQYIVVQIHPPSDSNPQGVTADGFYKVVGNEVSLTDRNGSPVRDGRAKMYCQQLRKDEQPRRIAGRLLKDFHSATHANKSNFNRTLSYPKTGIA